MFGEVYEFPIELDPAVASNLQRVPAFVCPVAATVVEADARQSN